jgi:peptide/nickel transport system permease protein
VRLTKAISLRILFGILSLIFISFIVFIADEAAPGDAADTIAGEKASPRAVQDLRHKMGLDRPWPERYKDFAFDLARADFGNSLFNTRRPVREILAETLPMTAKLAVMAIVLASLVGIGLGLVAAVFQNRWPDRVVLSVSTLGVTVPNFVLAPLLVYVFVVMLDRLPLDYNRDLLARGVPEWKLLLLPVICLAARPMAMLTRLTRASMIDTMQQEFIRTAIAKGVPPLRLIFRHGLRNAILPVVTAIGTSFGFLLTGSFVVETFFRIPGIGREAILAIQNRDTPVVQAAILVTGAMFIILNLLVDIVLPLLDPRIREAQI